MVGQIAQLLDVLSGHNVQEFQNENIRIVFAPKAPKPVYYPMPEQKEVKPITDEQILFDPYAGLQT